MARITNISKTTGYNSDTGEITQSEETHTLNIPSEPEFIKVYLNDILYLSDLPRGLNRILYSFLKRMNYGNELVINASLKRVISKEVNLSVSSINNAITGFVKGEILQRKDIGMYLVNPHLFGKGQWKDIARLRLNVTYDINGKTFAGQVEKVNDYNASNQSNDKELKELFNKEKDQGQDISSKGETLEETPRTQSFNDNL